MTMSLPPLRPVPPLAPLPPAQLNYATPNLDTGRKDLRAIAIRQKAIQFCILGEIAMGVSQFALPAPLNMVALAGLVCVALTAVVFAIMLSISVFGNGGIVLGILTLIPYLGLIFLLIVNVKATSILRQHRIHVGLLGANISQIPGPENYR